MIVVLIWKMAFASFAWLVFVTVTFAVSNSSSFSVCRLYVIPPTVPELPRNGTKAPGMLAAMVLVTLPAVSATTEFVACKFEWTEPSLIVIDALPEESKRVPDADSLQGLPVGEWF